jgi:hypothetical protein
MRSEANCLSHEWRQVWRFDFDWNVFDLIVGVHDQIKHERARIAGARVGAAAAKRIGCRGLDSDRRHSLEESHGAKHFVASSSEPSVVVGDAEHLLRCDRLSRLELELLLETSIVVAQLLDELLARRLATVAFGLELLLQGDTFVTELLQIIILFLQFAQLLAIAQRHEALAFALQLFGLLLLLCWLCSDILMLAITVVQLRVVLFLLFFLCNSVARSLLQTFGF